MNQEIARFYYFLLNSFIILHIDKFLCFYIHMIMCRINKRILKRKLGIFDRSLFPVQANGVRRHNAVGHEVTWPGSQETRLRKFLPFSFTFP